MWQNHPFGKHPTTLPLLVTAALLITTCARAYWPTSVEENLAISADPDTFEWYCSAIPYHEGSTLVVFKNSLPGSGIGGEYYQIVDRFGELKFAEPQKIIPGHPGGIETHLIADGEGGAFAAYAGVNPDGIYAQRLDSLGNRLWGDDGVRIFPIQNIQWDICTDNQGGLWLATIPGTPCGGVNWGCLWLQRIEGSGNLAFGDSGIVVQYTPQGLEYPFIVPDEGSGCLVVWVDGGLPQYSNAILAQHYDENGAPLWFQNLYICENTSYYGRDLISDGQGGFIFHANPGLLNYNTCFRVDGEGNILWERDYVSWWTTAKIVPGEPGFFYLGYTHANIVYGQRMDMGGNPYWPYGHEPTGAVMFSRPGFYIEGKKTWSYAFPYFYAFFSEHPAVNEMHYFIIQKLDSLGHRMLGEYGALITQQWLQYGQMEYPNICPDAEGGCVAVWEVFHDHTTVPDVLAKRIFEDGTLGGPLHLLVDLEPQNPPIQIPPQGGSFQFNVAIEDTYCVASVFDLWVEATLPGGASQEIAVRQDIPIDSFSVISRSDIQQFVPAAAPVGEYSYTLLVGDYNYPDWFWAKDEFTFEKLGVSDSRQTETAPVSDWELREFFDELSVGWTKRSAVHHFSGGETCQPLADSAAQEAKLNVRVSPNPFNAETKISFTLPEASRVKLDVFDIGGRVVGGGSTPALQLINDWMGAGLHEVTFDGSELATGIYLYRLQAGAFTEYGKMILLK